MFEHDEIGAKKTDLVSTAKRNKSGQIINVEILENGWVRGKEDEKVTKYHCKRSSKLRNLGCKNKCYSSGSGSNSNNNNNNNKSVISNTLNIARTFKINT